MADVVSITGEPLAEPGKPNAAVVEKLQRLLTQAEAGQISGIAGVVLWPDSAVGSFRGGDLSRSQLGSMFCLMQQMADILNAD